jgi:zinc protease
MNNILKNQLRNGLIVLLKEVHTAPLVSHWVWYRVGSRNEVAGRTGISHWVEHMLFKGTPTYPGSMLDKHISRDGGMWNAFTFLDWTAYFETLPCNKIDLPLHFEPDRMANSLFEPEEVESERTVILSELQGKNNEPISRLEEAVQSAAFDSHPYHNEVIGSEEDLRKIQRDDLYQHYKAYYTPSNAVLAVAGDFSATEMLRKIEESYGALEDTGLARHSPEGELPLRSERVVDVLGPGDTTFMKLAYRAPVPTSPDFYALTVLDSLLSGPSSLNMFGGGGITNKTSRLYRSLVERELAVGVGGGLHATIDPFLYMISITVHPQRNPEEVLQAVDSEIARLQDNLVSDEEIRRAVKQARAQFSYASENITNQAFWMGYTEMFDHYTWFEDYLSRLEAVTADTIQQAAREWLDTTRRVVGTYHPEGSQGRSA